MFVNMQSAGVAIPQTTDYIKPTILCLLQVAWGSAAEAKAVATAGHACAGLWTMQDSAGASRATQFMSKSQGGLDYQPDELTHAAIRSQQRRG